MKIYETVISIVTEGDDAFEAGERVGELIDINRMDSSMTISCKPTTLIDQRNNKSDTEVKKAEEILEGITERK